MERDNVISFANFKRTRFGDPLKENPLSKMMEKDLRDQNELIQWYIFHSMVNKHKLFVHTLFYENHKSRGKNPNSGFVVCFQEDEMKFHAERIMEAVQWDNREGILISAEGKSVREIAKGITGIGYKDNYDAAIAIEDVLLNSDKVLVIQGLSKMKSSIGSKSGFARSLIKVLDDAHFKNIQPKADLIFIDSAKFLQNSWKDIGTYLNILS